MPVCREDVFPAIVIEIKKSEAPSQKWDCDFSNARLKCHIREVRSTFILIESEVVVGEIRDVEGELAVIRIIANRQTHGGLFEAILVQRESRGVAVIFESA